MAGTAEEKQELTRLICDSISRSLHDYAGDHPESDMEVADIREILTKIIDYIDIADISGYGPWK